MNSTVINDDVLNALGKMIPGKYKLIVSSPPYNIRKEYEKKRLSMEEYADWMRDIARALIRVLQVITTIAQWSLVSSKFILLPDFPFPWFGFAHAIIWSAWAAFCTFKFLKARTRLKQINANE